MSKIDLLRKILRSALTLKLLLILVAAGAGFFCYARFSSGANRAFAAADDFPRGALVYAQFRDLPALLKTWDESELQKQYLASENFRQFQNRHLALKLAARWQEFDDALGFSINGDALAAASDASASVAIYDIGKLEIVFIAPIAEEKFAATLFFQNREQFEASELSDGTIYYSRAVEADRGRQRQKILFANAKGRFVLATSENLLLRALANINGKSQKDSLADEPTFADLAKRSAPHLATVWVDQARLNEDWYFRRYWLMRNVADLKRMRAGMFDFEMRDDKLIERREFLLAENKESGDAKISVASAARLQSFIPADAPFFRLQNLAGKPQRAAVSLRDALFDRLPVSEPTKSGERWYAYDGFDGSTHYGDDENYEYLGSAFDGNVDEDDDAIAIDSNQFNEEANRFENDLQRILANAQASAAAAVYNQRVSDAPLFFKFEKAVVFYLDAPQKLDRQALENAIAAIANNRLAVANERLDARWETNGERRELKFPALNREICYEARENALVVANSREFLKSLLNNKNATAIEFVKPFDDFVAIRLDRRESAFDAPMNALFREENKFQAQPKNAATDFFAGNIASLLTAAGQAKQIEIKRNHSAAKFLSEEITVILK